MKLLKDMRKVGIKMGKIGTGELILVLVIALVIFGPSKLPELGKALGETFGQFKNYANKATDEIDNLAKVEVDKEEKGE